MESVVVLLVAKILIHTSVKLVTWLDNVVVVMIVVF